MSTPKPFGTYARSFDDGTGLTTEQRLQLALIEPNDPNAMGQGQVRAVTQNRIRSAMAELAHGNIEKVRQWIETVAAGVFDVDGKCIVRPDPARAIELFMELAQFSLPKLKAVAISVSGDLADVKTLKLEDLQKIVSEQ